MVRSRQSNTVGMLPALHLCQSTAYGADFLADAPWQTPRPPRSSAKPHQATRAMTAFSVNSPSVLVGIATRNRAPELAKAIESAFAQSHRPLRVVVIDDASTDDTPLLRERFPAVSWERRKQPEGYVRARNRMMLNSSETYYASLDDDSWFLEGDELAEAIAFLEGHPDVAALAFDILSPDRPARRPRAAPSPAALFIGCG